MKIEIPGLPYPVESVGPDCGTDAWDFEQGRLPEKADWLVEWYENGCYDGTGEAVWKVGTRYYWTSLSHCSCYGPWGDGGRPSVEGGTAEELRTWLLKSTLGTPRGESDYDWKCFKVLQQVLLPRLGREDSENGND